MRKECEIDAESLLQIKRNSGNVFSKMTTISTKVCDPRINVSLLINVNINIGL